MKKKIQKRFLIISIFSICIALACSFLTLKAQKPSGDEKTPNEVTESDQPSTSQPTESILTDESPIHLEIYEYKEGRINSDGNLKNGDGWKIYHIKFDIVATSAVFQLSLSDWLEEQPYIITTDGSEFKGYPVIDEFNFEEFAFIGSEVYLFPGIPVRTYLLNDNTIDLYIDFSIPETLTPKKFVLPGKNYSIDLPSIGTQTFPEISLQKNRTIDAPGSLAIDNDITVFASGLKVEDTYVVVNYQISNGDNINDRGMYFFPVLVDSFGLITKETRFTTRPGCRSRDDQDTENWILGPGQTMSGEFCFEKNDYPQNPSFYVLYFSRYLDFPEQATVDKVFLFTP